MIFGIGNERCAYDVVRGERPRFVEFGNYTYTTGSGKNRTTHQWGYVAVKLDVPLPHIVLDATGNNSLFGSNLPGDLRPPTSGSRSRATSTSTSRSTALPGYERDALYLFTPDIMARFIDNAAVLDVEIVDDWLFLYGTAQVLDARPGDVGVAVLGRRRAARQVRAVGALARRASGDGYCGAADDGCRGPGIRRIRGGRTRGIARAPAAARGGAARAVAFSAVSRGGRSSSWPRSWCSGCSRRPGSSGSARPAA